MNKAHEELQKSELHYRMLMEQSADGIFVSDAQGNYTDVNLAGCKMLGYNRTELLALHLTDLLAEEEFPRLSAVVAEYSEGKIVTTEWRFKRKDGSQFYGELIGRALPDGSLQGILRDVTEQKKAHEKIMKANRLYAFISQVNQSIVQVNDEQKLLDKICGIAIDFGKFKTAWIGLVDAQRKINVSSLKGEVTKSTNISQYEGFDIDDPMLRNTLMAKALRTERYAVNNDLQNDPEFKAWREYFIKQNVHAGISVPIFRSGKAIGFFTLQADAKDFFDDDEIRLLEEAAGDISFALTNFDKEKIRHRAEEKLKLSEAKLREAQSIAHVGSWELDLATGASVWSDETRRIFGLSMEENVQLAGTFLLPFIHPDDLSDVTKKINDSYATLSNISIDHRIIRRDGSIRYIHTERRFEFDKNGKALRLYGITHDVTESKKAALEIEENERKYRHLFYDNPMPLLIMDPATLGYLDVNKAALILYGYSRREFLALSAIDLRPESEKGKFIGLSRAFDQNLQNIGVWIHLKKDGTPVDVEISAASINFEGAPARLVLVNDITEKKKIENQIKFDKSNLDALINNTASWLWSVDLDFRLITFNKPINDIITAIAGRPLVTGANMLSYAFSEEQAATYKKFYERAFAGEAFTEIDYTSISAGVWSEVSFYPICEGEKVIGAACHLRDITERKVAEEKLRRNEAQLKKAQAIALMGSWELDLVNNIVTWSDEQFRLLGFTPDEVVPANELFFSMVHPDDSARVNAAFNKTIQDLENSSVRFRLIRKDGAVIHVLCEWKFEFVDNHKPRRIFGILQNLTERIKFEEQQELFTSIFNSSDDAIISKNLDGTITSWNHGAEKVLGYAAQEIIGRHISVLIPPQLAGEEKGILERICRGESVDHYETQRVKKDGTLIYASLTVSPIKDSMGQITGASKILRDVTERKIAKEKLLENFHELQAATETQLSILDALPANIALLDKDGFILEVNESWKAFGHNNNLRSHDYCISDNYLHISENATGPEAEEGLKIAAGIRQVINGKLPNFEMEYSCNSPTESRWFKVEVAPLMKKGRTGAVVMHLDITHEKLSENKVHELNETLEERVQQRTADLTEANKALEAFTSTVSHDLRAPVRAVNSFAKIIQQDYADKMDKGQKELFGYIEDSGRRMGEIIDDLLKLAKYGHDKLKLEPVDMTRLVNGIWLNISRTTQHHAVLELAELPVVDVDMSMMQQVVVNLLSNAIKYSSKKQAPVIKVWCEQTPEKNTIYFKDNGAGFDMKNYARLFGAFQRLHTGSDFEGTGVGLTLVKRIIEKHGGTVGAEGKTGEGATFYFTLPVGGII